MAHNGKRPCARPARPAEDSEPGLSRGSALSEQPGQRAHLSLSLRFCISHKFPDADAAGPGATLWGHRWDMEQLSEENTTAP